MIIAITALLLAVAPAPHPQAPRAENVLILVADDVGIDKIAAYGRGSPKHMPYTPAISALAESGVRFRNAYSNPMCSPTRATILTGRYSFRTGVGHIVKPGNPDHGPLSLSEVTLPEVLTLGNPLYTHAAIGKWHLGDTAVGGDCSPILAGFGHFAGVPFNLELVSEYLDWPKVVYDPSAGQCVEASSPASPVNGCPAPASPAYATTDTVSEALGWIQVQGGPWVCYVAFNAAHTPFHRPPHGLYPPKNPPLNAYPQGESPAPYLAAMIEAMDAEIGRLLACMDPDVLDRTLILFMGDNGTVGSWEVDGVNYDLVFPPFDPTRAKGYVFELGTNVPFIASGAGVVDPGRWSDALVNTTDVFATVAEIAQIDLAALGFGCGAGKRALDSVSFLPLLADSCAKGARTFAYSELFVPNFDPTAPVKPLQQGGSRMIRNQRFKLILQRKRPAGGVWGKEDLVDREFFYDLLNDPYELRDLLKVPSAELPSGAVQNLAALREELGALLASCP